MTGATSDLTFNENGLIPAIVQDDATGSVLMLGWMNEESVAATKSTGLVHFWSRSRRTLWQKGETSGNVLRFRALAADCDRDAILVLATPVGPTCHTGSTSCFADIEPPPVGELGRLWSVISQRATDRPAGSYTTTLLEGGVDVAGRKVTEEATEVLMAAKNHEVDGDDAPLVAESADLLYHLLVLLAERNVSLDAVMAELADRRSESKG